MDWKRHYFSVISYKWKNYTEEWQFICFLTFCLIKQNKTKQKKHLYKMSPGCISKPLKCTEGLKGNNTLHLPHVNTKPDVKDTLCLHKNSHSHHTMLNLSDNTAVHSLQAGWKHASPSKNTHTHRFSGMTVQCQRWNFRPRSRTWALTLRKGQTERHGGCLARLLAEANQHAQPVAQLM